MKTPIIIFLVSLSAIPITYGQIEEIKIQTQQNGEVWSHMYRFTSVLDDTVTIRIVDPRGELISVPVQNRAMTFSQSVPFSINTTFWRRGEYNIIVESRSGSRIVKRLNVDESGKRIKK